MTRIIAIYGFVAGLIVAVPTLFLHSFFSSQVTAITDDVEATSVKLIHAMSGLDQPKNVIPMSTAQAPANGGHVAP